MLAGAVNETVGATFVAGAFTLIVTVAEVVTAPELSVAFAVRVYVPVAIPVHVNVYGAAVLVEPAYNAEPLKNSTFVMVPSESAALAVSVTEAGAVYVTLFAGAVKETVGATFVCVGTFTLTETAEEVVAAPALSVAFAVRI